MFTTHSVGPSTPSQGYKTRGLAGMWYTEGRISRKSPPVEGRYRDAAGYRDPPRPSSGVIMCQRYPTPFPVFILLMALFITTSCGVSGSEPSGSRNSVPQEMLNSYNALIKPQRKLPSKNRSEFRDNLGKGGLRTTGSGHRLQTPFGAVWVLVDTSTTSDSICLASEESGAVSCAPTSMASRLGVALGTRTKSSTPYQLLGIVPNGVRALKVQVIGGRSKLIPVRNNTYAMQARRPIMIVRYCRQRTGACTRPPVVNSSTH